MASRSVLVGIVSTANCIHLRRALSALQMAAVRSDLTVYVLDNDSRDGTAEMLASEFPRVRVCTNAERRGVTANRNRVLREANFERFEFVLLMDEDVAPHADSVDALIDFAESHPAAGIVAPRAMLPGGELQTTAWHWPTVATELLHALTYLVTPGGRDLNCYTARTHFAHAQADWVTGLCLLVRSDVLRQVGLFDEAFPICYEEIDLQRRVSNAGWEIWLNGEASVTHFAHGSSGKKELATLIRAQRVKSRYLYQRRYAGRRAYLVFRLLLSGIYVLRALELLLLATVRPKQGRHYVREAIARLRFVVIGPETADFLR